MAAGAAVTSLIVLGACGGSDAADEVVSDDTVATPVAEPAGETEVNTAGEDTADGPAAVVIADFMYDPNPVEVAAGTEISWTNEDSATHTVTGDGDLEFDSGNVAQGESFSMSFDEVGTYAYVCTIHSQMEAEIVVS